MARSVPYRVHVNDVVNWRQAQAANATIFILKSYGPTSFLLQEEGETKKYKVLIGDPHNCTCLDYKKEKDLCKHICWVLLKKYRLDRDDPMSWQLGLVEREINNLVTGRVTRGSHAAENATRPSRTQDKHETGKDSETNEDAGVQQRPISDEDVCPICQEPMLPRTVQPNTIAATLPVTFCRGGCGNSIHVRCMCVWVDHQKKKNNLSLQDQISCPVCRGEFATYSRFLNEVAHFRKFQNVDATHKIKWKCENCQLDSSGYHGVLYRCTVCPNVRLCENCFYARAHMEHSLEFKEENSKTWLTAPSQRGMRGILPDVFRKPNSITNGTPHGTSSKLTEGSTGPVKIHKKDLDKLSSWKLKKSHRLLEPGHQCRLCLMCYKLDDRVRRLPSCSHIFHSACLDPWLLNNTTGGCCPLCGAAVILEQKELGKPSGDENQIRNQFGVAVHPALLTKQIRLQPITGSMNLQDDSFQGTFSVSGTGVFSASFHKETSDARGERRETRVHLRHKPPSIPSRQASSSTVDSGNSRGRDPRVNLFVGSETRLLSEISKETVKQGKITKAHSLAGIGQRNHAEPSTSNFSPASSTIPPVVTTPKNEKLSRRIEPIRQRDSSQQRSRPLSRCNSSSSTMSIQSTVPFRRRNSHHN